MAIVGQYLIGLGLYLAMVQSWFVVAALVKREKPTILPGLIGFAIGTIALLMILFY